MTRQAMWFRRALMGLLVFAMLATTAALFERPLLAGQRGFAPFNRRLTQTEEHWIERTLASLTLDEKIGQLFAVDGNAVFMNRESEEYRRLFHHIVDNKVGTVILFRSDVWASVILINRMQQSARLPLLVSSDLEMGPGMRLDDTLWWAPNMAVAATGDTAWARKQGEATARQARAIGINWIYAPVADVNNNPDNPVINTRSYGEDPQMVARFVSAFIEGVQTEGALATAKHFPGHGDTATDSHIGLPVVDVSRERLDRVELVPFRAAIASGVGSIMSAHIALPQIEPEVAPRVRPITETDRYATEVPELTASNAQQITLPGTLSAKILTGLLREDLNFKGLVTTDALSMAGIAARFDSGTSAVRAIKAGADIVLKSPDIDAAIAAIRQAVSRGEISRLRIDESARRVLRAKAALGLNVRRTVPMDEVDRVVSSPESQQIAQEIADRSITLVRDERKLLPLDLIQKKRMLCVTLTDDEDRGVMLPFISELRRRELQVETLAYDNRSRFGEDDVTRLQSQLEHTDVVILAIAVRTRSGKGTVGLPGLGDALLKQLTDSKLPMIAISFGNPYLLQAMPEVPVYLAAYSSVPISQSAAARAILGDIEIGGRLPVSLPGLYPRGHGIRVARKGK